MKLEEDIGPDRRIEIETDDEENEAEIACQNEEGDTESDVESPSRDNSNACIDCHSPSWPQSYRYIVPIFFIF